MSEAFRYRRISRRLTVRRGGDHLAYREAFDLTPADDNLMPLGLLSRAPSPGGIASAANGQPEPANDRGGNVPGSILIPCEPELIPCEPDAIRAILRLPAGIPAGRQKLRPPPAFLAEMLTPTATRRGGE